MAQTFARRAGLVLAGTGVYVGASGIVYLYMTAGQADQDDTDRKLQNCRHDHNNNNKSDSFSFVTNPERVEKFDDLAAKYDYLVNNDERFMGMTLFRKSLLYWHARGTVLEMAAGTGRNCSYYPVRTVDRVLMTDTSAEMLQQARRKIADLKRDKPTFAVLEADSGQLEFPDNSFDTVVDTFGLCSFDDPVAVLKEMERVCKPDGKILLLEHGRSKTWQWITNYLDKNVERHAKNWGCVYNRDLDRIVEESGLLLETLFTWHFGTTYYMVCRPNKKSPDILKVNSSNKDA